MIDLAGYKLVIFDKDGTLIDFDAMWGGWIEALAARLEAATGRPLASMLFAAMDYDAHSRRTLAGGCLAVMPMAQLRVLTADLMCAHGLERGKAEQVLAVAWAAPDPAATARPLADLPRLFAELHQRGLQVAVATSDDRLPTLKTLDSLGVAALVDVVVAADQGVPPKPAPDMVWAACRATGVEPRQAIVAGDGVLDLQMGRAAGAGLVVGVTSGVSQSSLLAPCADILIGNITELL